jgi:hypothetical protein
MMSGQVVAVLYADSGDNGSEGAPVRAGDAASSHALELIARHASRCLEAVTAFRAARVLTERSDRANGGDPDRRAKPSDRDPSASGDADGDGSLLVFKT